MNQEVKVLFGIGLVSLVLLAGAVFFLSKDGRQAGEAIDVNLLNRDAKHFISSEGAKVTLVEFADFECPACANTYPVVLKLLKDYEGRLNYTYRNYPLPQHKKAISAINAAEAAGEQGKYWEMSELLYSNQFEWSEGEKTKEFFQSYAEKLQLDAKKFEEDYNSGRYQSQIQTDLDLAGSLGVNSTPTFYINGVKFAQNPTYENLKSQIEKNL